MEEPLELDRKIRVFAVVRRSDDANAGSGCSHLEQTDGHGCLPPVLDLFAEPEPLSRETWCSTLTLRCTESPGVATSVGQCAGGLYRDGLERIGNFTATIARIEADVTLGTHAKGIAVLRQLEVGLSELEINGELSERVEKQLVELTRVSLDGIQQLSAGFSSALNSVIRRYEPPVTIGERILYWWDTRVRPWLGR